MDKQEQKITNEKPVSLYPLDFKKALAALLRVKPPEKEKSKGKPKQKKRTGK